MVNHVGKRHILPYFHLVRDFHVVDMSAGHVGSNSSLTPNATLNPRMKTARGYGEYRTKTFTSPTDSSDIRVGSISRVWKKTLQGDIRDRVDDISKRFPGAGWKHLPQELVEEILGYLLDDPGALKACSLTCKHLFSAARPHIHRRLVCFYSLPERLKLKRWLFGYRKKVPGGFEQLIDADRLGVLRYTRHLTFKLKYSTLHPPFHLKDLEEYLPHLQSITKLDSLTLDSFHFPPFTPGFLEHFGMFTKTLRHLDIRRAEGVEWGLLYFICQFPLLEDLVLVSPAGGLVPHPGLHPGLHFPAIAQWPPLRGKLVLVQARSGKLSSGLASFPGGLNFRSLELSQCKLQEAVLTACGHTVTSISYLWRPSENSESNTSIRVHIVFQPPGTIGNLLDLGQNAVLERFELTVVSMAHISLVHEWVYRTLQTITSPVFKKFVIWLLDGRSPWTQMNYDRWEPVDALLAVLAERNPDFKVEFIVTRPGGWTFLPSYLPLVRSMGLMEFSSPRTENRFKKLGAL